MTSPTDDTPRGELILHQTEDGRTRVIAVTPRACRAERAHERAAAIDRAHAPDHRVRRATRQRARPFGARAGQRPDDQQSHPARDS